MPSCADCFEVKVSKTVNTLRSSSSVGCCSAVFLVRRPLVLLATCRSIQHALTLLVGMVSGVVCILHGLSSHPSRTVPLHVMGLDFFTTGSASPARMHPFCPDEGLSGNRWFPEGCLSFPGAFHCAVLLYDGCQVREV